MPRVFGWFKSENGVWQAHTELPFQRIPHEAGARYVVRWLADTRWYRSRQDIRWGPPVCFPQWIHYEMRLDVPWDPEPITMQVRDVNKAFSA